MTHTVRPTSRRSSPARPAVALAAVLALAACAGDAPDRGAEVVRDSVGDTLVVRTTGGSVWGEGARLVEEVRIGVLDGAPELMFGDLRVLAVGADGTFYLLDAQLPAVRVFAPDGSYLRTLGRRGQGPGELQQPDWGMVVLSDGRVAVRDPGNARMQLYDPATGEGEQWPVVSGGMTTTQRTIRARGDTLLTPVIANRDSDSGRWTMGMQRVGPDGAVVDTLTPPTTDWKPPEIEARSENSFSIQHVPFAPNHQTAYHPDGYWIAGVNNSYGFTLLRPGSWLRIERDAEPVPVAAGEKAQSEALIFRNMRRTDPGWRWNGPAIPDTKPAFGSLFVAEDGRIVTVVELTGVEGEDPDHDPTNPESIEQRWRAPRALDFFETDGTYLGRVALPDDIRQPAVIRGEYLWAIATDDLGVARAVRYRIDPDTAATEG